MATYYEEGDLNKFSSMGEEAPELWKKFMDYYGAVFADGALTAREKALIALAVAYTVQCPYCIDSYTQSCLSKGVTEEQMTEAAHVACALRGGASLAHGVQMKNIVHKLAFQEMDAQLSAIPPFESMVKPPDFLLTRETISVMQVNVGRLCNLACKHCHMEAGPQRAEIMGKPVMEACLDVLRRENFDTLDITGGAPEMNPNFRWFAHTAARSVGRVIVRTNLVIMLDPGYEDMPQFYRDLKLDIACSLPHYTEKNTDKMRGDQVFCRSIEALRRLNALGYGIDPSLPLNLVFNPGGAFLPPGQQALERDFRENLKRDYGVEFTGLLAITNNPVGRFGDFLARTDNLQSYMERLYQAFNADTLSAMMCRGQISVAYDGRLYDCDFNQAAGLPASGAETIFDLLRQGKQPAPEAGSPAA